VDISKFIMSSFSLTSTMSPRSLALASVSVLAVLAISGLTLSKVISDEAWKSLLEMSSLLLSIVNGLILLWMFARDRPRLVVNPVHEDSYNFLRLSASVVEGEQTRRYGFLVYLGVANRGLRDVQLSYWHLHVKNRAGQWIELKPLTIPPPEIPIGETGGRKIFPVLGGRTDVFSGETMIASGGSIAGYAYYELEVWGGENHDPHIVDGRVPCRLAIGSVFGDKVELQLDFPQIPLTKAKELIADVDKIGLVEGRRLQQ